MKNLEKLYCAVYGMRTLPFIIKGLDNLSPRHRKVLSMRFGLEDGITNTLETVAKEFGVTRERIRQIEAKCLEILREEVLKNKL